jgi:outer membrane protein TolC
MREELIRAARAMALAMSLLGLAVSASGQTTSAAGDQGAAGAAPVRQLSVDEAVRLALEQNLNVQVERLNPQVQELGIRQARAAWAPVVGSSVSNGTTNSRPQNFFLGTGSKTTNGTFSVGVGASQQLRWGGGSYSVSWGSGRDTTNNLWDQFNPVLSSSLSASFTQPLLRNLLIDPNRLQLIVSKKNREISDIQLRQTVLTTVRSVKNAYWDLSYAVSNLAVQRQTLDLARESLKNNRARVEIGTMAPIDIVQAEAEVATREESVIVAEERVASAEDRLRALILDPATPNFWNLKLELTDQPTFQARPVDIDAAVRNALDKRTDLAQSRKSLETNDVNLKYYRNQTLPAIDFSADFRASGIGGTLKEIDFEGVVPVVLSETKRSYGDALREMLRRDYPSWTVELNVSYPIGTSSAEANLARARLQRQQLDTSLRNQELQIASQVRDAGRQVNTNLKRVEATRVSRQLEERKLEAEQKKFAAGMSTSYFVLQAQRDLAAARNAELSAVLDYNRSLVDFEAIQEAPVAGGGAISISSAGSGASSQGSTGGTSQSSGSNNTNRIR